MLILALLALALGSLRVPTVRAAELVHVDAGGVIRWNADDREVALLGANYCLPSACDYRAAGLVGADRKKLVEADLAHFARMGWDGMRLCLWGDWENCDKQGNLIVNDHLDVMDYAIAEAKKRGVFILFTPITTYSAWWPDGKPTDDYPGFSKFFRRDELGTNPEAIAAERNYLRQILEHVNPYTGVALKDEPQILFIEMINEPVHQPQDFAGSVAYIDALVDAVRSTGCAKILFHNVSQDMRITPAIKASKAQGVSFAWYPTGLNSGHELRGNHLRFVDDFPPMLRPDLLDVPKIVYEFDSPDMNSGYMYPAMARAFRGVGAQFVAMFSYDMLATAPYNLGWQTHFLNLVYSPKKAVSAIIAAEVMRTVPRYAHYGDYPDNTRFGPFRVSYEDDSSEMVTDEIFLHANVTHTAPPHPEKLKRIVGVGSSPLIDYAGNGAYFLDRLADGVWRLEIYPDIVQESDPFARTMDTSHPSLRAVWHERAITLKLPDLGGNFSVAALDESNPRAGAVAHAEAGRFAISPGVYLLSRGAPPDRASLPPRIGHVALAEFVCPKSPVDPLPESAPAVASPAIDSRAPFLLFDAARDIPALVTTRIGDTVRRGIFKAMPATDADPAALRLMFPLSMDRTLDDYTTSLAIKDRIRDRAPQLASKHALRINARGMSDGQRVFVTLVEADGTSWTTQLALNATWQEIVVPLETLKIAQGVKLPQGYPERWNYWMPPAKNRGAPDDRVVLAAVEHVQISLRPSGTPKSPDGSSDPWAEIASIALD